MDIYLNFDGVLHPDHLLYEEGCVPSLLTSEHSALEYACFLVAALESHVDAAIVLNTWWTFYIGFDACKELLPAALSARVIGSTVQHASTYDQTPVRYREVQRYIARRHHRAFLIVDHGNARYSRDLSPHLLLLDPLEGLSNPTACRSLERRIQLLENIQHRPHVIN
jgi:hypothetical protein